MNIRMKKISLAVVQALSVGVVGGLLATTAQAQQPVQKTEKIEVTGSNIKRIEGEGALPVTVIKAEELNSAGITTVEQALQRISANQTSLGITQSIGSTTGGLATANLRGLGSNKTLVLLNGRRIANQAYSGASADLNAIPVAALDRIEVLRDGASAIYGSDAIGGVINFITKRDFTGVQLDAGGSRAQEGKGGQEKRATLTAGFGSLEAQGFNLLGVFDFRKQDALTSLERSFASTGVFPDYGVTIGGTSGTGWPANFTQPTRTPTALGSRNPFAPGCTPSVGSIHLDVAGSNACRFDFVRYIDLIPENEATNIVGRGTIKLGSSNTGSVEYVRAESKNTARVAPTPVTSLSMPANSPYFPGAGITPAVTGVDPTKPITVAWRTLQAGKRTSKDDAIAERLVADIDGSMAGWDYKGGVFWSRNTVTTEFTDGYVQRPLIVNGIAGTNTGGVYLNPFGAPTAAELAYLESVKVKGKVLDAVGEIKGVDAKASREIGNLAGGPMAIAVGAEYRKEKYAFNVIEETVRAATSSGLELAEDIGGTRNASAFYAEMNFPLTKELEAQLAVRRDQYQIVGGSTNPKFGFRWQPSKEFLIRGSANTGFRAPTLYDLYQPNSVTFTANSYNDPLLCPGGVPVAGADAGRDCAQQFRSQAGGNTALEPEKSKTNTLGFVWEPTQAFSAGVDYWRIKIRGNIGTLPEQTIFGNPPLYAQLYVRCGQLSGAARNAIDPCTTPNSDNALAYIIQTNQNLGGTVAQGYDLNLQFRLPQTPIGRLTLSLDGTYVDTYDYQREKFDQFVPNAGQFVDSSPVFRWQHTATATLVNGPLAVSLTNRYKSHYRDANYDYTVTDDPSFDRTVDAYSVFDLSVTYTAIKNLTLLVGVKNLADKDPPFSNQSTTFQRGYDPRYSDPLGRTWFARVSYLFK